MIKKKKYKIGDNIIELGKVFHIFKVVKTKSKDGAIERVLYFKPLFGEGSSASLICSIPSKNIKLTKIRKPINIKQLKELISRFGDKSITLKTEPGSDYKEYINSNDPVDTVDLIRHLHSERKKSPDNFSSSKDHILKTSKDKLVQEFALVARTTLEKAKEKIDLALK